MSKSNIINTTNMSINLKDIIMSVTKTYLIAREEDKIHGKELTSRCCLSSPAGL